MPSRPAPRKPAARPPSRPRPGRLKKPPPAGAEVPIPGLPGWVKVRLNGCALPGAVDVLGGGEKVRVPREPELKPPPTRASADDTAATSGTASAKVTAIAWTMPRARCVNFMTVSLNPRQGEAPLTWAVLPKSEAAMVSPGCGPRSRGCGNTAHFGAISGGAAAKRRSRIRLISLNPAADDFFLVVVVGDAVLALPSRKLAA